MSEIYGEISAYKNLALAVFAQAQNDLKFSIDIEHSVSWRRQLHSAGIQAVREEKAHRALVKRLKIWAQYYKIKWDIEHNPVPKPPKGTRGGQYRAYQLWAQKYKKQYRLQQQWKKKKLPPMPRRRRYFKVVDSQEHGAVVSSAWEFLNQSGGLWHDWIGFDPRIVRRMLVQYEKHMKPLRHSSLGEVG